MAAAGLDLYIKDIFQILAWIAAVITAAVAAYKLVHELLENRRFQLRELRWKKAQLAREVLRNFFDAKLIHDAVTMLDWTGRVYEISPQNHQRITWEELGPALRVHDDKSTFTLKEVYIRDCFDALFDAMELLEHYLRTELSEFADIQFPMEYHVAKLREYDRAVSDFLEAYGFDLARSFAERFPQKALLPANRPLQPAAPPVSEHRG